MQNLISTYFPRFFATFVITSTIGVASYFLLRACFMRAREASLVIGGLLYIWVFGILLLTGVLFPPVSTILSASSVPLWILAALAEKAIYQRQSTPAESFIRFGSTILLTFLLSAFPIALFAHVISWQPGPDSPERALTLTYMTSTIFSPFVPPISMWIWKRLQLHPGFDRSLYEDEEV